MGEVDDTLTEFLPELAVFDPRIIGWYVEQVTNNRQALWTGRIALLFCKARRTNPGKSEAKSKYETIHRTSSADERHRNIVSCAQGLRGKADTDYARRLGTIYAARKCGVGIIVAKGPLISRTIVLTVHGAHGGLSFLPKIMKIDPKRQLIAFMDGSNIL